MRPIRTIPKGERCSKPRVADSSGWHFAQCSRRGTIMEDNKLWCFQHTPASVRKRKAESKERWEVDLEHRLAPGKEIERLRIMVIRLVETLANLQFAPTTAAKEAAHDIIEEARSTVIDRDPVQ